jgi:hypothetical protein
MHTKLTSLALGGALMAAALAPAAGSAATTKTGNHHVKPDKLNVYKQPSKQYLGLLTKGDTFKVTKLSASGKYAYGKAYGHVNKTGWVLASSLD